MDQAQGLSQLVSQFSAPDRQRRSRAPEYYWWKLTNNPSGKGVAALAVNSENTIVASTTAVYKSVWVDGRPETACEFGDSFTNPAYQKQGIMSKLVQKATEAVLEDGVDIIYTTPNHQSRPGYEKRCSFLVKEMFDLYFWSFPLTPFYLAGKKIPAIKSLRIFDPLYKSIFNAAKLFCTSAEEKPLLFDESYDRLNKRLVDQHLFLVSKNAAYMHFRYCENPDSQLYGLIESRDTSGNLEAALIYKVCSQSGMKVFFVADMFGINRKALSSVWTRAIVTGSQRGFDIVAFWGPKSFKMLKAFAPLPPLPLSSKNLMFYKSQPGLNIITGTKEILFAIGDSDNV